MVSEGPHLTQEERRQRLSYVCRLRDNSAYQVLEERPLSEADRAAGILSDQIVRFPNGKADAQPDHKIRLVCIRTTPHTSRGKYRGGSTGPGSDGVLRIATNLLDVPVEILSLICRNPKTRNTSRSDD